MSVDPDRDSRVAGPMLDTTPDRESKTNASTSANQTLVKAASFMETALRESTGLKERERRLVIYWTLATHALRHLDTFPLLSLCGKMGTGKSETEKIIERFAYRPRSFGLRGRTLPIIRDELAECYEGTAVIEEADHAWKDGDSTFEQMLSDRYQRRSGQAGLKEKSGDTWTSVTKMTFGATVLHRRIPFDDAALDGRSIQIRFRADHNRKYREFSDHDSWIIDGWHLIRDFDIELPPCEQPMQVAARIFNTYKPILSVASMCGDEEFPELIRSRLLLETAELKDAQSAEPDGLVLRAILAAAYEGLFSYIRVGLLAESILRNHRVPLQPRQVAGIARQLGFTTKNSHGYTVVVPTPATLLAACNECGCEDDEMIVELRKQVLGAEGG